MDRIERAVELLELEQEFTGDTDFESAVSDVLTDLMHFCHLEGYDFDAKLQTAIYNFEEEK